MKANNICLLVALILTGCVSKPAPLNDADLPMFDEGDRVCVLVRPDFIYCQPKAVKKPETMEI